MTSVKWVVPEGWKTFEIAHQIFTKKLIFKFVSSLTDLFRGGGGTAPWNVVKCFLCCICCLKSQLTKYICIILRKCRQLLGTSPLDPAGGLPSVRPPHCPPLEKNPAGAHESKIRPSPHRATSGLIAHKHRETVFDLPLRFPGSVSISVS